MKSILFSESSIALDKAMNGWFASIGNIDIISVTQSQRDSMISVLIIYKQKI